MSKKKRKKKESVVVRVSIDLKKLLDEMVKEGKSYREASEELVKKLKMEEIKLI